MSDASGPYEKCPFCRRDFPHFEVWCCECGEHRCCRVCRESMRSRIPYRHRSGDCGHDAARREAMSKDD